MISFCIAGTRAAGLSKYGPTHRVTGFIWLEESSIPQSFGGKEFQKKNKKKLMLGASFPAKLERLFQASSKNSQALSHRKEWFCEIKTLKNKT